VPFIAGATGDESSTVAPAASSNPNAATRPAVLPAEDDDVDRGSEVAIDAAQRILADHLTRRSGIHHRRAGDDEAGT
jgi:hypothetical protein